MADAELKNENKEIYGWLNELASKTGLSAALISELYLQGWIVKTQPYTYKSENGVEMTGEEVIFWKWFREH